MHGGWLEEVSEWCHDVGLRERVGHLVYKPEVRSYIRGRHGCREFNCSRKFASWFHCCGSDLKSCKLDCVLREDELVWIQGVSVRSALAQPVCSVKKTSSMLDDHSRVSSTHYVLFGTSSIIDVRCTRFVPLGAVR